MVFSCNFSSISEHRTPHNYTSSSGSMLCKFTSKEMHLERINSFKKGFGTEGYQEMMRLVFENNIPKVTTDASWSSHVFHTFMGMIPSNDRELNSVKIEFGVHGIKALTKTIEAKESGSDDVQTLLTKHGQLLKIMLLHYAGNSFENYDDIDPLKLEEFNQNFEKFKEISNKTESYIQTEFLPMIIAKMKPQADGTRCSTDSLNSVIMHMSPEGMQRWKETIEQGKPFVPFKDLSHLRMYMNDFQANL